VIQVLLTGGQVHDSKAAQELLEGVFGFYVIEDKGYDSRENIAKPNNTWYAVPSIVGYAALAKHKAKPWFCSRAARAIRARA